MGVDTLYLHGVHRCCFCTLAVWLPACGGGSPPLPPPLLSLLIRLCFVFSHRCIMAWWRRRTPSAARARLLPLPATCDTQRPLDGCFYCVYSNLWSVSRLDYNMLPPLSAVHHFYSSLISDKSQKEMKENKTSSNSKIG